MTNKTKIIILIVLLSTTFALGRYTVPTKVVIETKTVETEKKTVDKTQDVAKNTKKKTTTTETVKPDGEKITTTVVDEETVQDKKTDVIGTKVSNRDTSMSQITESGQNKVTISLLGGLRLFPSTNDPNPLVYGLSITKPILGPFTVGLWGLSNSTIGASAGLTF